MMQRDYDGFNYHTFSTRTYISLIKVLKSTKKKYSLGQET